MPLRALYVDFNSYFASVEQQERPELRGKPVAVLPVIADTTCCIAASYEAKKFGVKTGTRVSDAKRLCPGLRLVEARPATYVEYHHRLVAAVESCIHVEQVYSIDEMTCELLGRERQREQALAIAGRIKRTIADTVGAGLRCSIGIAPNTFLAKTASDMQKPDGCVVIEDGDLPQCLFGLQLRDLCGIGAAMEKRLRLSGIHSVEQLCRAGKLELRKVWGGVEGERVYARLRGEAVYTAPGERSSVGHSHVLPPHLRSREAAYSVLHRLLQKAAVRLRDYHLIAGTLHVSVKYVDGARRENHIGFDPTSDTVQLLKALARLWREFPPTAAKPLAVGVTLLELFDAASQSGSLFERLDARDKLNAAIDKLNLRYGKNTLYFGGAHLALKAAPMRISFNHIPDVNIEGD